MVWAIGKNQIYYLNISEDRKNNSENYQKIIAKLEDQLQYDEEGTSKIEVTRRMRLRWVVICCKCWRRRLQRRQAASPVGSRYR